MAGNSYPHIVFAKDAQVLPQERLAELLAPLFPDARVESGEIKADLHLADFTYTFWYDDDADGLGERYADFAAPLRRKRVTRCTTMIDASGDLDPEGRHAADVARIMETLAAQEGVYVFSEDTRRFVGMDYEDTPAAVPTTPTTVPAVPVVEDPAADPRSPVSPPAHATPAESEVRLDTHESWPDHDPRTDESHLSGSRNPDAWVAETGHTGTPAVDVTIPQPVEPAAAAATTTRSDAASDEEQTVQPETSEKPERKGFFKKLFGRRG